MNRLSAFIIFVFLLSLSGCGPASAPKGEESESLQSLAEQFKKPSDIYRPYVWWHWMGSNFSKEGITKDLETMKEAGIGGATIYNLSSGVQESYYPMEKNPWPEQTYRSKAYWDAMRHAASEAKRLGLKLGMQSTPGYSTIGGPWISEEQSMQMLVFSETKVTGGSSVKIRLEKPEPTIYKGWGTTNKRSTLYKDVDVMAVPEKENVQATDVLNISANMDSTGLLTWQAPVGAWRVYRIGHASTMSVPHPSPDELIGKTFEVDKMNRELNVHHWQNVLNPLREEMKEYIGDSFTHILIDSYEAEGQDWTPSFREDFMSQKGYDPLPWVALRKFAGDRNDLQKFSEDYKEVVSRLFIDRTWTTARDMIHDAGLQMYWEPYFGPFDIFESTSIPDVPMCEYWTNSAEVITPIVVEAAHHYKKRIVGVEAFSGRPEISKYTEDPAYLKHPTDGAFVSGVNWLFMSAWTHQPFGDQYKPGLGMGWWGTHFGRLQTWMKPAKAFFTYITRCQMLLQQGEFVSTRKDMLHRTTSEAEIFFVINPSKTARAQSYSFPVSGRIPELWRADDATIRRTSRYAERNDSIYVDLTLEPDESVFVIFPRKKENGYSALILPEIKVEKETLRNAEGPWNVSFEPGLGQPFRLELPQLIDFSQYPDLQVKYFSGKAVYEKTIAMDAASLGKDRRVLLDLGELHDIAELTINGQDAGVLWYPPYKTDITPWLKQGDNAIKITVTNNWANRLIGDEQYPADFEWGQDRGVNMGRAMKAFPDWFLKNEPRPSERKTFNIWYYYRKDSPLQPAGLIGPVSIVEQQVKAY